MLFSIITVTRNNAGGLKQTCQSLQEQSFTSFEWIVIDGASEDGTVAFLENAQADYISEPDNGIYDAMNKGIERARGFYLLFLNAGDRLATPHTLKDLAAYIENLQETPDFLYGDSLETKAAIQGKGEDAFYKPARPYCKRAYGMFTHHQAMFYRRELLAEDLRYDQNYAIAADYKFTLQFLERARTIVYCPFPLCLFEAGGLSQRQATQGRREQFDIRHEIALVSPWRNRLITLQQNLVWSLRAAAPALYRWLKSRRRRL